jgi:hypothetical protein
LPKVGGEVILEAGGRFGEQQGTEAVSIARPGATAAPRRAAPLAQAEDRVRPHALVWLPAVVLGAGLAIGLLLWGKWGFAIAFEAIRTYCL